MERSRPKLVASANKGIDTTNRAAISRDRLDPTWATSADPMGGRLVAEIAKGSMEEPEVREWLLGLDQLIEDHELPLRIAVHDEDTRVPDLTSWHSLTPAPTAFLHFTDPSRSRTARRIDLGAIRRTAAPLVEWTRIPGATLVIQRGLSADGVVTPGDPSTRCWRACRRIRHSSASGR